MRLTANKPVIIEVHADKCESFAVPAKEVNGAVLFAVHKFDEDDYDFVKRWSESVPFYIVNNGDPSEWAVNAQQLPNVKFIQRENKGHDIAAWSEGMDRWDSELSKFDVIAFVNNSCVYYIDLRKILVNATDYDVYGLSHSSGGITLPHHIQTTFIVINRKLYNSKFFKDHWNGLRSDKGHLYAIMKHECQFTVKAFAKKFKVGVYDFLNGETLYEENAENDEYKREFSKKWKRDRTTMRTASSVLNKNIEHNRSKGYAVIDLTNSKQ